MARQNTASRTPVERAPRSLTSTWKSQTEQASNSTTRKTIRKPFPSSAKGLLIALTKLAHSSSDRSVTGNPEALHKRTRQFKAWDYQRKIGPMSASLPTHQYSLTNNPSTVSLKRLMLSVLAQKRAETLESTKFAFKTPVEVPRGGLRSRWKNQIERTWPPGTRIPSPKTAKKLGPEARTRPAHTSWAKSLGRTRPSKAWGSQRDPMGLLALQIKAPTRQPTEHRPLPYPLSHLP